MKKRIWMSGIALFAALAGISLASPSFAQIAKPWGIIANANERFVVLETFDDLAILDKSTNLIWERTPSTNTAPWYGSYTRCLSLQVAAHRGWRLPKLEELRSLTVGVGIPAGIFTGVSNSSQFWSSSYDPNDTSRAFIYRPSDAGTQTGGRGNNGNPHRAWCVRGGAN